MSSEQLLPDPPLGNFPWLPEGFRWYVEPRDSYYDRAPHRELRWVKIQRRRVETKSVGVFRKNIVEVVHWDDFLDSVWTVKDGLGDFSLVGTGMGHRAKGLASSVHHVMKKYVEATEGEQTSKRFDHIHGVSVL